MKEIKKHTDSDLLDAVKQVELKHFYIINYLLNKNSEPLPRGVDYKQFFEDMEDFEKNLMN